MKTSPNKSNAPCSDTTYAHSSVSSISFNLCFHKCILPSRFNPLSTECDYSGHLANLTFFADLTLDVLYLYYPKFTSLVYALVDALVHRASQLRAEPRPDGIRALGIQIYKSGVCASSTVSVRPCLLHTWLL